MKTIRGHFDGRVVVLDEPAPPGMGPQTPVRIVIDEMAGRSVLDEIAELAVEDDLPTDFSTQHEHYVKGAPRR